MRLSHRKRGDRLIASEAENIAARVPTSIFADPDQARKAKRLGYPRRFAFHHIMRWLELAPEELVVDVVVELDFAGLDHRAQQTRAAISGGLLEVGVALLHI